MKAAQRIGIVVVVAGWLAAGMAGAAPIVVNPSFEDTPFPGPTDGWNEGNGNPVGWTQAGNSGGVYPAPNWSGPANIPDGTHAAYMWCRWGSLNSMTQVVNGFEVGKTYWVTYLENSVDTTVVGHYYVQVDGVTIVPDHNITYNPTSWYPVTSAKFTATSTSQTLAFYAWDSTSGDGRRYAFDNVLIQVPEPAAVALLALGGLGLIVRRRRQ